VPAGPTDVVAGAPFDTAADAGTGAPGSTDGGTRRAVARLLMEQGPCTATAVATGLSLSAPAVRRHLDALLEAGEAAVRDAPRRGPRGRGRPAKEYLLTDTGRARFGHGYDDLAVAALRYLRQVGGEAAVRAFADRRAHELLAPAGRGGDRSPRTAERVSALARVLAGRGYAARIREVGAGPAADGSAGRPGIQLCQHHCPVAHVAAEFPELCAAETRAFADLLGTHVQRLSTIARGGAACTTHVPLGVPEPPVRPVTTTTTRPSGRDDQGGSPA
jgi:predicted ArsR family transcriptional regulator